ncbi:MAG TPA: ABC transporter ATP-binding protein [Verrucomicrobiaceae bacterium]|jgi:putative ABC transport system ATP-binding protein
MSVVVKLEELCKTYHSGEVDVHAVRDVNLDIQRGEFVAVMGSSGSGKSSLMNMLGCLDRPTGGRYLLDGTDVARLSRNELATLRNGKLGFVFQSFNLLARTTAVENVELPLYYGKGRVDSGTMRKNAMNVLELVGLGQRFDHHPSQLSGGQQQRVAIARALIRDPEMLLADEPTGNLDTRTSVEIMGLFQRLNENGITIVMVTHELDIASYTKRNLIMRDGRLISDTVVANRSDARAEIARLDEAEKQAKLAK